MINRCSRDNTFQRFTEYNPMIERFGLEAFAFVGLHGPVKFYHFLYFFSILESAFQHCDPLKGVTMGFILPIGHSALLL